MDSSKHITHASFTTYSPPNNHTQYISPHKLVSHSSSPYKSRNSPGVEKFKITQSRKSTNKEIELINNRINQLIKLEEKAKKKIETAQKKAEAISRAKQRHEIDIKDKEIQRELRRNEEEEQRRRNQDEKERRIEKIKSYQLAIWQEKRLLAEKTKKKSKELDSMSKNYKIMIEQQKNERKNARYTEAIEYKQQRGMSQNQYSVALKEEYEKRIAEEKAAHLDLIKKKQELEKYEAELINKLANTELNQVEALKNLEALAKVSLFHLGIRP